VITGDNIIYFGPGKWDGMWRNRHQLMSRFARKNKVMYVEPVVSLSKLRRGDYSWSDFWQAVKRKRVTKTKENVFIYHSLPYVPISGRFPVDKITWWIWNLLFRSTLKKLDFSNPIIWLSRLEMSYFIGNFDEKMVIYHVVDEYLAYPGVTEEDRERLEHSEKQLLKKADMVIVVSEKLKKSKGVHNENTFLVKNGVDYESYNKALLSNDLLPDDIDRLPRPIIGYSGLISQRLDLDLIENIASTYTEWSVVLIGMVNDKGCESIMNRLQQMENVHFLGVKNITQVPYYVKGFNVGIIPYKINEETENLSALKLYDFLAIGMPIVTTDFPAVTEFKNVVRVADSKENFTVHIENVLIEDDENLITERRSIASQNTWEQRVVQLSRLIAGRLEEMNR